MSGRGPAPKATRRNPSDRPLRGEWKATAGVGWQHGEIPPCPARSTAAQETWLTWFAEWYAANWTPGDLPNLRLAIKLWARADSLRATGAERSELRYLMDDLGITRKGQQDRRWKPPEPEAPKSRSRPRSTYAHLQVVNE